MSDYDLTNLVGELKVSQTPVAECAGGGAMRRGRANTGTLHSHVGEHVDVPQAETVVSNSDKAMARETFDEPIELFPDSGEALQSGLKQYPIFQVPTEEQGGLVGYCLKVIGCGTTFCTVQNCTTNHQGEGALMAVMPGDVFVVKKKATSAFVAPSIDGPLIHDLVVQEWKTINLGLDEWSAKFVITSASSTDMPASTPKSVYCKNS
jgi:hypothetical protein